MLIVLMTFVFGFAAFVIAIYCGISFFAGLTLMFGLAWKLICLPFALIGAIVNLFRPRARISRALPKQTQYTQAQTAKK